MGIKPFFVLSAEMASELSPLIKARFNNILWRLNLPYEIYGICSTQPNLAIIRWLQNNAKFSRINKINKKFLWPLGQTNQNQIFQNKKR